MSSKMVLLVNTNNDGATTASECAPNVASNSNTTGAGAWSAIDTIASFLQTQALGRGVNIVYTDTAVQATATVTFTGDPSAGETMLLANVTLTARASGAIANEFNISAGNVTQTAANLAAAINASSNLTGIVSATSSLGVVTVTSLVAGNVGNGLQISESLSNTTATAFASGSESHRSTISAGL